MRQAELEELKMLIARRMDVDELMDLLGFTMFDLVDILSEQINEAADLFESALK